MNQPVYEDVRDKPRFNSEQATAFALSVLDDQASVICELPSERDQNFLVAAAGEKYVLKIANPGADRKLLEMQNAALRHLHSKKISCVPSIIEKNGNSLFEIENVSGTQFILRLVTYSEGTVIAKIGFHSPDLLFATGRTLGTICSALRSFKHAAAERTFVWDLDRANETISQRLQLINDPANKSLIESAHAQYVEFSKPLISGLRKSVIHNDANDYNIVVQDLLVTAHSPKVGLIDFGDIVHTTTINELAICLAYLMLDKTDPLRAAAQVVRGFHSQLLIEERELEVLFDLCRMRLCMSVCMSAEQQSLEPENEYLLISQKAAWKLLTQLQTVDRSYAQSVFRDAAGFEPHWKNTKVRRWLSDNRSDKCSLFDFDLNVATTHVFDLSVASNDATMQVYGEDVKKLSRGLFDTMAATNSKVGLGRYNEPRVCYRSDQFQIGDRHLAQRSIHLGLDFFLPASAPVFAPLEGTVHSFANNDLPLDYGPTIILEHNIGDGDAFYSLFGHLSVESLERIGIGDRITKGQQIGTIGDESVNGGWPPHLHFQLMTDMLGMRGDFPGVADPDMRDVWTSICPDPNLLLGMEVGNLKVMRDSSDEIASNREKYLSKSLSLSYQEPLHMVRGSGQYLYDVAGRSYLDLVNNVCHVGHCHPHVVEAVRKQVGLLNTNTRYLHPNIVRYAERLCRLLPEPLNVCFFVNSGSEANDLALRMAACYTNGTDVVVVDGAYHGHLASLIDISPYKFDGPGGQGREEHVHVAPMPDGFRGEFRYDQDDYGDKYARQAIDQVETIGRTDRKIKAFICEALLSCGGQIELPGGYLESIYKSVRADGGICIADEVQVGFGRVGTHFWGFETQNVVPDIVTMGKPIGNGHPLAAVVTTREIADSFAGGMEYFNTYGGNPVSCAVGLAVLDVIENEKLQERALQLGTEFKNRLQRLQTKFQSVGDVRGRGMFLGIEIVNNKHDRQPYPELAAYVVERMKEQQVLLSTDGPDHNVIKIKPPLAVTEKDLTCVSEKLERVLQL